MSIQEYGRFRFQCKIHKLKMHVNFPCKVIFLLKNDSQSVQIPSASPHSLENSICEPNQSLAIEQEVGKNRDAFVEAHLFIKIFMISANGKISVGSVLIHTTEGGQINSYENQEFPVEKCPDGKAAIFLSMQGEFLQNISKPVIQPTLRINGQHNLSVSMVYENNFSRRDKKLLYSTRHDSQLKKFLLPQKKIQSNAYKTKSKLGSSYRSGKFSSSYDSSDHFREEKKKYADKCDGQKQQLIGEIPKLNDSDRKGQNQEQTRKFRDEVLQLTSQLTSCKQKVKKLQKKNRESAIIIKSQHDENQKITAKYMNAELIKNQQASILEEKQKQIKYFLSNLQKLKQQNEDIKIKLNMQEKKIEYKEQVYKEQIKKLHEKYQKSEYERQKSVKELNDFLSELGQNQKKHQIALKKKELIFLEEKNSLVKECQNQRWIHEKSQISREELHYQNNELQNLIKSLNANQLELRQQLSQQKINSDRLTSEIQRKLLIQKNMQRQIDGLKTLVLQVSNSKKKINEVAFENQQLKDKFEKLIKIRARLEQRLHQTQQNLSNVLNQKSLLSAKMFEELRKKQNLQKSEQIQKKQIQALREQLDSFSAKNAEIKARLENERYHYEEQLKHLSQQMNYLEKNKEHLQIELQQLNYKNQQSLQSSSNIQKKYNEAKQEIIQLTKGLLTAEQIQKKLTAQNKLQQAKIEQLNIEKSQFQIQEKYSANQLKQKQQVIYQLQKQVKEKKQQIHISNEKSSHNSYLYSQEIRELKSQLKNTHQKHQQKVQEINYLEIKLSQKTIELLKLIQRENDEIEQIKIYKQNLKSYEQKVAKVEKQRQQNKISCEELSVNLKRIQKENQVLKELTKKQEKDCHHLKEEHSQNRKNIFEALKILLEELAKEDSSQNNLHSFSDQALTNLQIELFKCKSKSGEKYKEKIRELEQENKIFALQLKKTKSNSSERQNQLQNFLNEQRTKNKLLEKDSVATKNQLLARILDLDEIIITVKGQNQRLGLKIEQQKQIIEEHKKQGKQQMNEINLLRGLITEMRQRISLTKSQQEKEKRKIINEYNHEIENKKQIIEQQKQSLKKIQNKLMILEKNILEKQEKIKKQITQKQLLKHQNQKLSQKIQILQKNYFEAQKKHFYFEQQLKNQGKNQKQKDQSIQKLQLELKAEKNRNNQLQLQKKQYQKEIDEKRVSIFNLAQRLKEIRSEMNEQIHEKLKKEQINKKQFEKMQNEFKTNEKTTLQLKSEIQLKNLLIDQQEKNIQSYKNQINQIGKDLRIKKEDGISQENLIKELRNELFFMHQKIRNISSDKSFIEEEVIKYRRRVEELFMNIKQYEKLIQNFHEKEQSGQKIQQQLIEKQDIINQLEQLINQLHITAEEKKKESKQLWIRIYKLEQQRTSNNQSLNKKEKIIQQSQSFEKKLKEKICQLQKRFHSYEDQNRNLQKEMANLRHTYQQQISEKKTYLLKLTQKEQKLQRKEIQISQYQEKIKNLEMELKSYFQAWNQEKVVTTKAEEQRTAANKYQKWMEAIELRSQKLISKPQKQIPPS